MILSADLSQIFDSSIRYESSIVEEIEEVTIDLLQNLKKPIEKALGEADGVTHTRLQKSTHTRSVV